MIEVVALIYIKGCDELEETPEGHEQIQKDLRQMLIGEELLCVDNVVVERMECVD